MQGKLWGRRRRASHVPTTRWLLWYESGHPSPWLMLIISEAVESCGSFFSEIFAPGPWVPGFHLDLLAGFSGPIFFLSLLRYPQALSFLFSPGNLIPSQDFYYDQNIGSSPDFTLKHQDNVSDITLDITHKYLRLFISPWPAFSRMPFLTIPFVTLHDNLFNSIILNC